MLNHLYDRSTIESHHEALVHDGEVVRPRESMRGCRMAATLCESETAKCRKKIGQL
jgi:hypothetical protein